MGSTKHEDTTVGAIVGSRKTAGFDLTATRYRLPTRTPWHSHEEACLTVVLEGSYREEAIGLAHSQEVGTLLFKPPGEPHRNRFGQPARTLLIQFDADASQREQLRAPFLNETFSLRSAEVAAVGQRLQAEFASDVATNASIESWILELLGLAARARSGSHPVASIQVANGARDWLHAGFRDDLNLSEVARELDVSPAHLARSFRKAFGCTMGSYQRQLRVRWAFDALRHGNASLSSIAHSSGFCDQSHLNRVFQRHLGLTPGDVRAARRPSVS